MVVNKAAGMAGSPTVRVSGPGLPSGKDITGTTTLENLVPGTYAVAPQDLLEDGVRFRGTASPANPAVEAGRPPPPRSPTPPSPPSSRWR